MKMSFIFEKFLPLTIIFTLALTGCNGATNSAQSIDAKDSKNVDSSVPQNENKSMGIGSVNIDGDEYKTISVSSGNWTFENRQELLTTLYLNNKPLAMPFTLENMGADYTIHDLFKEANFEYGVVISPSYKGKAMDFIFFSYDDSVENLDDVPNASFESISVMRFSDATGIASDQLVFNGITLGSSKAEVEKAFGKADLEQGNLIFYNADYGLDFMHFAFKKDRLVTFTVLCYETLEDLEASVKQ